MIGDNPLTVVSAIDGSATVQYYCDMFLASRMIKTETLKKGDKLMLSDDITLTIVSATEGYTKLGIDAPKSIPVHREEVYRRIQDEKQEYY